MAPQRARTFEWMTRTVVPLLLCAATSASLGACGTIPSQGTAEFVPNDATPQCETLVMCLNQRICDLSTASQPATWCRSTPRPTAVRAECEGGYTAITFTPFGSDGVEYFYFGGSLVAAVDSESDASDNVACKPGGGVFQLPACAGGIDLCADVVDAGGDGGPG